MDRDELLSTHWTVAARGAVPDGIRQAVDDAAQMPWVHDDVTYLGCPHTGWLCVATTLDVDLPSRGPADSIDIRAREPIIVRFPDTFPYACPEVMSDRRDFPTKRLPHLDSVVAGSPQTFCLFASDRDDWYVQHDFIALMYRIREWLQDAAAGDLNKAGAGFEPIRVSRSQANGAAAFRPAQIAGICGGPYLRRVDRRGWVYVACRATPPDPDTGRAWDIILRGEVDDACAVTLASRQPPAGGTYTVPGLLVWSQQVLHDYDASIPCTFRAVCAYARDRLGSADVARALAAIDRGHSVAIPVFLVTRRPQRLIGTLTHEDTLPLLIAGTGDERRVFPLLSYSPYSPAIARRASHTESLGRGEVVLVGAGAVGSKIGMHLARAGHPNMVVVDHDVLLPHNMARHALTGGARWCLKANALRDAVNGLYDPRAGHTTARAAQGRLSDLAKSTPEVLRDASLVVDCSASAAVGELLTDAKAAGLGRRAFCSLADGGRIGITLVESGDGDPAIPDLWAQLLDAAGEDAAISDWLSARVRRQAQGLHPDYEILPEGAGCASLTMRVADDVVSAHSSIMSMVMRRVLSREPMVEAVLQLTHVGDEGDLRTERLRANAWHQYADELGAGWCVRVAAPAAATAQGLRQGRGCNETGGILLGRVDARRCVIRVTRAEPAPSDSHESPYGVTRGVHGVAERVRAIRWLTGGTVDYLGDWHSHPPGTTAHASEVDMDALRRLHRFFRRDGLPALMLIFGENDTRAYVM